MTFYYKKKVEKIVIYLLESGDYTLCQISKMCNISISTVRKIASNYDGFYAK